MLKNSGCEPVCTVRSRAKLRLPLPHLPFPMGIPTKPTTLSLLSKLLLFEVPHLKIEMAAILLYAQKWNEGGLSRGGERVREKVESPFSLHKCWEPPRLSPPSYSNDWAELLILIKETFGGSIKIYEVSGKNPGRTFGNRKMYTNA